MKGKIEDRFFLSHLFDIFVFSPIELLTLTFSFSFYFSPSLSLFPLTKPKIHPSQGDQVYAQQQSTLANKAYATLKEPLSRANYLLDLSHAPIHESESLDNPELLMEVMEARELLEDAQTEAEVQDLKDVNDARVLETCQGLSDAFKERDLETAKELAIKLQYWIRIRNVIRDWAAGKPVVADHV